MAEINFNNLYNQLKPMEKRYYDQQFFKNYVPGQENIKLSSQPAYEQMKAVYDAQQQVPETGIFDSIFGSASAAEMPQVPNLTYRNIDLPFDLRTGVTNTTAASPFLKSMADIDPKSGGSGVINSDLVNQLIMENQMKASQFDPKNIQSIFPTNFPSNIRQDVPLQNLGIDTSYGVANEKDVEQEFLPDQESSGITKLFEFLGKLPTPFNLARRGLESLRGLNQKIRSTDFAQSKTLADYFDARRYGGRDARDAAAARNMAQARGIQKKIDTGRYRRTAADNVIDRGRGENNIASRAPKGPTGARRGIDARNKSSIDPAVGRKG